MVLTRLQKKIMSTAKANLSPDSQVLLDLFREEMDKLKTDLRVELTQLIGNKFQEVDELKTRVQSLEAQLSKIHNDLDWSDQYERKDMIILSGPAIPPVGEENDPEFCNNLVRRIVKENLNVDLAPQDINTCHRLQPRKRSATNAPIKTNIVIKFCRRDLKKKVIMASKKKRTDPKLFANESLTTTRRNIFQALRKMKADNNSQVKGCTTMDGKIYAYTKPLANQRTDQKHHISNMVDLRDFCRKFVQKPLETFLENVVP